METEVTTIIQQSDYTEQLDTIITGIDRIQLGIWTVFLAIMAIAIFTLIMWLSQKFSDF